MSEMTVPPLPSGSSEENGDSSGRESIIIRSSDDAWQLLQEIEAGREFSPDLDLRFEGWPVFEMRVQGRDWDSTVPTRVMTPLLEVQKDLYRTLMLIRYGKASLRRLTDEDRELLELVIRVGKGSSDYKAPLHASLNELVKQAIGKMESKHIVQTLVCVALVYGAVGSTNIGSRPARHRFMRGRGSSCPGRKPSV